MRLTTDQIRMMAAFESVTGVLARDCIFDDRSAVFVVDERSVGKAVGKKGQNVKKLQNLLNRRVEVIGYSDDPVRFLKNIFHPAHILAVNVIDKNGKKIARVHIDKESKRIFERKIESRMKIAKTLAKRYFNIDNVVVM
ncbi:MAG: NusA-like transcription termination signal-binding factor [Candidatus Diapherotrites archaeon]|nr:NusA-like transcription termination signal-binding factor [Candidatus Diapherotrites archaeon]